MASSRTHFAITTFFVTTHVYKSIIINLKTSLPKMVKRSTIYPIANKHMLPFSLTHALINMTTSYHLMVCTKAQATKHETLFQPPRKKKITEINPNLMEILVPYKFPMGSWSGIGGSVQPYTIHWKTLNMFYMRPSQTGMNVNALVESTTCQKSSGD